MASQFVKDLIAQMTIEEKIGQMIQIPEYVYNIIEGSDSDDVVLTGPMGDINYSKTALYNAGSMLTVLEPKKLKEIQAAYIENHRLSIPLLFMFDIIHGYKTIFPINLGLSASWDETIVEKTSHIAAVEGSAAGHHVTFAPMCDLVRDPRWGRVMESPGEDPYLNGRLVAAAVRGFQQESFDKPYSMVACTKHFAGYGASEGGRDYNTVDISERWMKEYYLPAYKAALDAGSRMVMTSFNLIEGIPATINDKWMKGVLRDEWGFDDILISDWAAPEEAITHGAAEDEADCCVKSIDATLDIEMSSNIYYNELQNMVKKGHVDISAIDKAVERVLTLKEDLGLFKDPYRDLTVENYKNIFLCKEHRDIAKESVIKSSVLLKNDGTLPFSKDIKTLAIIGPHSDNQDILGEWKAIGDTDDAISLAQGIRNKFGDSMNVITANICDFVHNTTIDEEEVAAIVDKADAVILAIGEASYMSGESGSRSSINVPGVQQLLAETVLTFNKPTATVLFTGRPLELDWFDHYMPAILNVWFPGTEGGNGIAELLFGDAVPSGKITMSFPRNLGQVPVYYNSFRTGRPIDDQPYEYGKPYEVSKRYFSNYLDVPNAPLYPFGYGLSYTSFEYSNLKLSSDTMTNSSTITVSVEVKNTGQYDGVEIIQLYIHDKRASVARPVKELKGYEKTMIPIGETKTITFEINESMLRFYTKSMTFASEKGDFDIFVGANSSETLKTSFKLI